MLSNDQIAKTLHALDQLQSYEPLLILQYFKVFPVEFFTFSIF